MVKKIIDIDKCLEKDYKITRKENIIETIRVA